MAFPLFTSPRALLGLSVAFLQVASAGAGTVQFTQSGLNARTSLSFRGQTNILTTVPKGTEGEVLERFRLPSGNYGIKLKVTKLGHSGTRLKTGEEIWVYYHRDADARRVELFDDEGKKTADAESGQWAIALSTFKVQKSAPKKETVCETCNSAPTKKLPPAIAPIAESQLIPMEAIIEEAVETPTLDVGTEEIVSFIRHDQEKFHAKHDEATARKIAEFVKKEAAAQGVSIPLILAVMSTETGHTYRTGLTSRAGAIGLMQLLPSTYASMKDGVSGKQWRSMAGERRRAYRDEAKVLSTNIHYGVKYLAELSRQFGGDEDCIIAGYNGGPGAANKVRAGRAPKSETRKYLVKVKTTLAAYALYEQKSGTSVAAN